MSLPYLYKRDIPVNIHLWNLTDTANALIDGRSNAVGTFTLTAGATTTDVEDNLFQSDMVPVWSPMTANAAAAVGTTYLSARTKGGFTITHTNNAQTDRTFGYVRFG
jgi:hypothetical protein